VALEGFTHLIPFAAGHEIIRQQLTDLTLIRMTPDCLRPDDRLRLRAQAGVLVGRQSRRRLAAPAPRRGRARLAEPLEIEEHSHSAMAHAYAAGASGCPAPCFAVTRARPAARQPANQAITCPFTGEVLTAGPALRPDVAVIHAQKADRAATCSSRASSACRRKPCWQRRAPSRRGGDRRRPRLDRHECDGAAAWTSRRRARAWRRRPSYAHGYYGATTPSTRVGRHRAAIATPSAAGSTRIVRNDEACDDLSASR
jgi:glutaconate CoA-transferase subunit A